ncbi:hypothetical protein SVAN01_00447 [Stagonosporopsis vannaccii]|nr:hypothetical protein SVAN01_00447 [Stagonosporopsis vannaccii]
MSTARHKSRKLSSIVKCGRCRQDRQKCERPDVTQKCLRCAKYKHECDSGRASNRAQRSQNPSVCQRALPATTITGTTYYACSATDLGTCQEAVDVKLEDSSSSRTSRSTSSERCASWSTLSTQDSFHSTHLDNANRYENRHDSASSIQWQPSMKIPEESPFPARHQDAHQWEPGGWRESRNLQRAPENPYPFGDPAESVGSIAVYSAFPFANTQAMSGLTNIRPSRHRTSTPFEQRLDTRIDRLWGNYKTFATASSKGPRVTPLFGRTLSELFRQSKQMAENGDDLVADVRYACGAADACMNRKLPEKTRAQYLEAYHRYDARANVKYHRAVNEFAKKIAEDESPDVLPLYIATFLYYAAGACMRGSDDLLKATFAFKYFNQFTAWFPIRIKILPAENGTWAADMLLANNNDDPGMRINTLMFALGRARLEFDRKEGLC